MKNTFFTIVVLMLVTKAFCAELLVPSRQFPTIQSAIDAAGEGDTIVVQPGIYYENVNWDVNNLTLTSTNPQDPDIVASTVINGSGGNALSLVWSVTGVLIEGLTITGGSAGIYGNGASVTISHCIIRDNTYGVSWLNGTISNCLVYRNNTGIDSLGAVINCTIVNNTRGILSYFQPALTNCVLWGNQYQIQPLNNRISVKHSCIQGGYGGAGNIDDEPQFSDAANDDYRLLGSSPCIDSGKNTWPVPMPATDLGGNYRQIDGNGDGIAVVDMGAYEYGTVTGPIVSAQPEEMLFLAFEGGPAPAPQTLYICNIGLNSLSWSITEDCTWLSVSPASGSSSGDVDEVTISADSTGLDIGRHIFNLEVRDSAGPSRAVVQVSCVILDEAYLNVPLEFPTIQSAIDAANPGDTVVVAPGTYTGEGNQNISFSGKAITVRSIDPNDPSVVDNTVIEGESGFFSGFKFSNGEDANSVLEGLTITNFGGAVHCEQSSPTIRNCNIIQNGCGISIDTLAIDCPTTTIAGCRIKENDLTGIRCDGPAFIIGCDIRRNQAGSDPFTNGGGGGVFCSYTRTITTIADCNISENTAYNRAGTGVCGGGIFTRGWVVIDNCRITNNQAELWGGGVCNFGWLKITRSVISGNVAQTGGGICVTTRRLEIYDSIVAGNFSQTDGGGIYIRGSVASVIANGCTIGGNVADGLGGGIYCESSFPRLLAFSNIFWGNSDSSGTVLSSQITPTYSITTMLFSCIQDADSYNVPPFDINDNGIIVDDPLFVRIPNDGGDGWGVGDNDDYGDLHLLPDSPCIDASSPLYVPGPNVTDIDGQARLIGSALDMGADEYGKMITVNRPIEGEVWATGSRHQIKWSQYGVDSVDVLLCEDAGQIWETIAAGITDANSFLWTLPGNLDSNQCIIAVVPSDGDVNVVCYESGLFEIKPYPRRPPVPPGWRHRDGLPEPDLSRNKGPKLGCVKWVFETNGPVSSQVAVTRQNHRGRYRIYVGCEDGLLYALNDDGELIWSYDINTPIVGSPAVGFYEMVYVAGQNGWLYAIDNDGDLRWTHTTDAPVYSTPVFGYDGKIYVCSEDGLIYTLDDDGSDLWTFETNGPANLKGAILASPAIDRDESVYIAGLYDPSLYALDANDGSVRWICSFASGQPFASPAIGRRGTIYQTLVNDTNLYAIDSDDGSILWRTNLADPCSGLYGSDYTTRFWNAGGWCEPAIGRDGTIYVCLDDPYLRAVRPDGSIKWVTRLGMVGGFTLSVDRDGYIYAASDDGFVCVVDSDGQEVSRFKGNDWVSFPAIAEDGTLIVSDANNRIWAIGDRRCRGQQPDLHIPEDIEPSWTVDFMDLALLAETWLVCTDPLNPQSCGQQQDGFYPGGDVDRDQYVDFRDFAVLGDKWLMELNNRRH